MIVVDNYLLAVGIFRYPGLIFYSKLLTTKNFELKIFSGGICRKFFGAGNGYQWKW